MQPATWGCTPFRTAEGPNPNKVEGLAHQVRHFLPFVIHKDGSSTAAIGARANRSKRSHTGVMNPLGQLFADQKGVVTRRQLFAIGITKPALDRMLRRRDLVRMLPGVFLNHTGEPTWIQRAWAGTLFYAPAALGKTSALRVAHGPGWRPDRDGDPITIAVASDRRVQPQPGYVICRQAGFDDRVRGGSPPRVRMEEAVLDVAAEESSEMDALEVLAEACRGRHTTAERLLVALKQRQRLRRRDWLIATLEDVAAGKHSVLERDFVRLVQRPHGLPPALHQVSREGTVGTLYDDLRFEPFGLIVELDGRLFHASTRHRDRDLDRDLDAAVDGRRTVRLGWGQVHDRGCVTAARLSHLLTAAGWKGSPRPCSPVCPIAVQRVV